MAESAAYQVVARRYRPQRFDELVGQEHVARGLSGAIDNKVIMFSNNLNTQCRQIE